MVNFFQKIKLKKSNYLIILAPLFLLSSSILIIGVLNFRRVPYGLAAGNLKIGGLNFIQAEKILHRQADNFASRELHLFFNNRSWLMTPRDLGISVNVEQTLSLTKNFGHGANWLTAGAEQIIALFSRPNIAPTYQIDTEGFKQSMILLSVIEQPAINASLRYDAQEKTFSISPAATGHIINRAELVQNVLANFNEQQPQNINLVLTAQEPLIQEKNLLFARNAVQSLIDDTQYILRDGSIAGWRIEKNTLGNWIETAPLSNSVQPTISLNQEKIKVFLAPIARAVNQPATDARLIWENDAIKFIILAKPGRRLNIEKSAQKISEAILNNLFILPNSGAEQKQNPAIQLIVEQTAPGVSDQNINELGLTSLLAKGESDFAGSSVNRQSNIKTGARKLNGWLIKPDEEFSFVQAIGEIDAANGWVEGLVIKNNQTISEYGGGICQVSTTLFRAAIKAGLKITERQAHAYPIGYYGAPGFDATVYPPKPDFKFINNTNRHVLLQNRIEGTRLIFEIYGQSDGRAIKIKGPTTLLKNPDGSMKTILTQEIWQNNQLIEKNDFRSNYKSPDLYPMASPSPTPTP